MKRDAMIQALANAHAAGRLAQAYVVDGHPRGEGRRLAEQAVQMLVCTSTPAPCGNCPGCRRVADGVHPNVLWVEPERKSRQISIDQIREMNRRVFLTSIEDGWKAGVILAAERMTEAAANAFLKTLEEPPARTLLLLVTDSPPSLMPTIRSRCQSLTLTDEPDADEEEWASELRAEWSRPLSRGSVLESAVRAERMMGVLATLRTRAAEEIKAETPDEAEDGDREGGRSAQAREVLDARIEARYRERRTQVMRFLLDWHRDILALVCGSDESLLRHAGQGAALRERARGLSIRQALANVRIVEDMNRDMESNLPDRLVLSYGMVRLS